MRPSFILQAPENTGLSRTDMLLEDVDFRKEWSGPRQLGHKALAVNLSDLAAMGVRPRFHTVSLGIPEGISQRWITDFYQGMARLAERHHVILVGGDLSHSAAFYSHLGSYPGRVQSEKSRVPLGRKPRRLSLRNRNSGKIRRRIKLVAARGSQGDSPSEREALACHRTPEPRCGVGSWLAAHGFARAMIDLSDGLSMDLRRLVRESGTGAEIYASALPVFEPSRAWGCDPLELGFYGGEDYELLFSVPPARASALERHYSRKYPQITRIGRLIREPGVIAVVKQPGAPRRRLPDLGFDHFRIQGTGPKLLPGRDHARKQRESRKKTKERSGSKQGQATFFRLTHRKKQLVS